MERSKHFRFELDEVVQMALRPAPRHRGITCSGFVGLGVLWRLRRFVISHSTVLHQLQARTFFVSLSVGSLQPFDLRNMSRFVSNMYHYNLSVVATWLGLALHSSIVPKSREVVAVQLDLIRTSSLRSQRSGCRYPPSSPCFQSFSV